MKLILLILVILSLFSGVFAELEAKNVMHQIIGGISFLIASITFVGFAIVSKLEELIKITKDSKKDNN